MRHGAITAEELESLLGEVAARYGIPGATAAVFDGARTTEAATGMANMDTGVEATPETLFQIGSLTKPYTASAVLTLVDEGVVELDNPVSHYVPGLRLGDPTATERVTVRQLLSHTSGIAGNNFTDFGRGEEAITRYVENLASMGQIFEAGRTFSYSNSGYVLLGRLIEYLTDEPYHRALRHRVLEPAGLTSTVVLPEDAILHRVAVGHMPNPDRPAESVVAPQWSLPFAQAPAGSMACASARDVLSFARLHHDQGRAADGTRVLSARSAHEMASPQVLVQDRYTLGRAYGLGWVLDQWGQTPIVGHDGATATQQAFLRFDPATGFAVALLTNQRCGGLGGGAVFRDLVGARFADALGIEPPSMPEPREASPVPNLSRYEGTYQQPDFRIKLHTPGEQSMRADLTPHGALAGLMPTLTDLPVRPADESTFLLYDIPGAHGPTPLAFFEFDGEGRPEWLHFSAQAHRRQ